MSYMLTFFSIAYDDVMKIMTIVATVVAVFPLIFAVFMPNWHLGDAQNAVENVNLKGERVVDENSERVDAADKIDRDTANHVDAAEKPQQVVGDERA